MKNNKNYIFSGVCFALFVVLIIMLKTVDVAAIGPENTSVGFAMVNGGFHEVFGYNSLWYNITKVLGIVSILTAFFFALFFIWQTAQRKDVKKVDKELTALMALYVLVAGLYVFFEKIIINYRPVIMAGDEHVEASFPSTHTMLSCVIMGSAMMILGKYVKNETVRKVLLVVCNVVMLVTVVGRLISGVHWFTDVLGGVLISVCLLSLFATAAGYRGKNK
ncbi:MAG: phosphatase PAP2 family protein [Butyrivibrio sp.]|nr:phosphatase PAP2 family protein [Butyrivibrio sp.]